MNIFVVSHDTKECAMALDDVRLRKMILESAQMLSTAVLKNGGSSIYKQTHAKHPCTLWTEESRQNFEWHISLLQAMHDEYVFRFEKSHKSYVDCFDILKSQSNLFPQGLLTPFANATPRKNIPDVFLAYRLTMVDKWQNDKRQPTWTKRQKPQWA